MLDSLDTLIAFVLIMLVVSLLITITVQMVSAALNLRGRNLVTGLTETLNTVSPALAQQGRVLAEHILTGPMLSDSSIRWGPKVWHLASAARPDEVFDALHRIATGQRVVPAELRATARSFLIDLGVDGAALDRASEQASGALDVAKNLETAAESAVAALPPEAQERVRSIFAGYATELQTRAQHGVSQVGDALASTMDQAYQKFEYWFEVTQDRAQQWFTAHTRFVTVFFAVIFAGWLQLDTVEIFKLVSSNRSVRDQLVAQAGAVSSQAAKLLGDGQSVLQEALGGWSAKQDAGLQGSLANLKVDASDTRGAVRSKVAAALGSNPAKDTLLADFEAAVDATASQRLDKQAGDFRTVKTNLDHTGFDLFPEGGKGRWGNSWSEGFCDHFWGMLFSAGLLSLGAPFWYNALKNLTSLRSVVAQNISEERKQQPPPTTNPLALPPPTVRSVATGPSLKR